MCIVASVSCRLQDYVFLTLTWTYSFFISQEYCTCYSFVLLFAPFVVMFILEYFRLHLSQYIVAEHRHVGSNNFNLVSSRSHTIFTLVSFFGIAFLWDFWNYSFLVYRIHNLNSIYCFFCYTVYLIDLKVYFSNLQKLCACRLLRVALLVKMKMRKKLDYLSW